MRYYHFLINQTAAAISIRSWETDINLGRGRQRREGDTLLELMQVLPFGSRPFRSAGGGSSKVETSGFCSLCRTFHHLPQESFLKKQFGWLLFWQYLYQIP